MLLIFSRTQPPVPSHCCSRRQADLDLTGLLLVSAGGQAGSSLGPGARLWARGLAQAENEGREVS